ncbi:histidine kinase [Paractinoplanes brasiliensis]|uniref:histidine kinase n=2 Tax=Paractinoplanes brasiliensis TaxID=52695 RepID=A0A4R6J886_9ACTN|nr:histidine kinase [Actinoplanes brasiliensis]GID30599.1 hypothetical protein Abr02nite_55820 [Actinoplanes brasiliensis]
MVVAWAACGVAVLAAAGAVTLGAANGVPVAAKSHLLFVMTCAAAGALVAGARPRNAIGWALLLSAVSFALLELNGEWAYRGGSAWPETWLWVPANLGMAVVPLLFPDGRPAGRRWWWLLGPAGVVAAAAAVLGAVRPGPSGQVRLDDGIANPLGVAGLGPAADFAATMFTLTAGLIFVIGSGTVLWRARHAGEERRRQIKWVAWAAAMAAAVVLARLLAGLLDDDPGSVWPRAATVWELAGAVAVSLLPAALTVAVLRHRLYDIDVLIARTLLYGTLSALLLGAYALITAYLGALLGRSASLTVAVPAAAAVAVAFAPLRDRLQRGIAVLLHGRHEEPYVILARLGRRLEDAVAPSAVLPLIAETVAETLQLDYVAVSGTAVGSLPPAEALPFQDSDTAACPVPPGATLTHQNTATGPVPPGATLTHQNTATGPVPPGAALTHQESDTAVGPVPPGATLTHQESDTAVGSLPPGVTPARLSLTHQGEEVGVLTMWPDPARRRRPVLDEHLLADLARQVGAAVHSVRLADDLRRSRERLVMAREEERRRLRRDLHDGLGPTLAALTMRAEAAQDAAPSAVKNLLARIVDDAEAAVVDVRRLVEGLRPPALDSLGLAGALTAHLAGLPSGAPPVRLVAPAALPALPAATEVAAYRIAVEAVTNVCRHSGAASASVRLDVDGDRLIVEIWDDGGGASGVREGTGLVSMRERADELGGRLAWSSGPGGTRIRAELPASAPSLGSPATHLLFCPAPSAPASEGESWRSSAR